MRVVTIVSLGASAVLGLAALFVAKAVLPNQDHSKTAVLAQQPVAGVPVVVAKSDLKFGDRLEAGKVTILHVPANAVPAGAFTTVEQVLAQRNLRDDREPQGTFPPVFDRGDPGLDQPAQFGGGPAGRTHRATAERVATQRHPPQPQRGVEQWQRGRPVFCRHPLPGPGE